MNLNLTFNHTKPTPSHVPNTLPSTPAPYRLAIIGESPDKEDQDCLTPFVGSGGQLLDQLLTQAGIQRSACLIGNVYQRFTSRLSSVPLHDPDYQASLDNLADDIKTFNPNCCLLLGPQAFAVAGWSPKPYSLHEWRGSILRCDNPASPFFARKVIPTFHPNQLIRQFSAMPLALFDIMRAKEEALTPTLTLPQREFELSLNATEIINRLNLLRAEAKPVSLDIEGYVHNITCVSFSNDPLRGFIVPLIGWPPSDMREILRAMSLLLHDPKVPKVLQNSLYDNFALAYTFNMPIRNVVHDTMLAGWEKYPELPKGLGTLASIYTREPFYKYLGKVDNEETHHRYCCTDSAVTGEIATVIDESFTPTQRSHYEFNMKLLKPMLFMQLKGIRYDTEGARQVSEQSKIKQAEALSRMQQRVGSFNPASPVQVCKALYDKLNFPVQHPKKPVGYGLDRSKRTSDVNAVLKLCGMYDDTFLTDLLLWRKLEKQRQFANITIDPDNRVRCSYNPVGTDTGRVSCSSQTRVNKTNTVGTNLQTIPKNLRNLYLPDPGYDLFAADLAGADGWTVAAHCLALGDPTMMDDYLFGLKPAKIIVLIQQHGREVNTWSREKLREASRAISEEGPGGSQYFAAKVIQHGTSYKMGPATTSNNVTLQAYKKLGHPIYVSKVQCGLVQQLFFDRYPGIERWHNQTAYKFKSCRGYPTMTDASGHIRTFFGRKGSDDTIRSALAHEPQANTTYATNMAMVNLWEDPENRRPDGTLIIEPLHQVHDELVGQWPTEVRDWARAKVRSYFSNPITIAGTTLTIPFDGGYGTNWKDKPNPL